VRPIEGETCYILQTEDLTALFYEAAPMRAKQPPDELDASMEGTGYYLDDFGGVLVQASKIYVQSPDWKQLS